MIALVEVAGGNCTWNVVTEVLSEPKSNTQIAPLAPALYINAPRAVNAPDQDVLAKVTKATPFEIDTVGVSVLPPAVYPEATTSPVVV